MTGHRSLLFLALFIICGMVGALCVIAPSDAQIASRERVAIGHFVAHVGKGKSSRIIYAYSVDGRSYKRKDSCRNWMTPCQIGSEVAVYYDPLNPAESKIMDYREDLWRGIKFCSVGIMVGVILLGSYFVLAKSGQRQVRSSLRELKRL